MSAGKLRKTMFIPLAMYLLADRYQRKDKNVKVIETPDGSPRCCLPVSSCLSLIRWRGFYR